MDIFDFVIKSRRSVGVQKAIGDLSTNKFVFPKQDLMYVTHRMPFALSLLCMILTWLKKIQLCA